MARPARQNVKMLPKAGALCRQFVTCGSPGCRCRRGQRHLALYLFWREGGRLRKKYVRAADAPALAQALREQREARRQWREQIVAARSRWRAIRDTIKGASNHDRDIAGGLGADSRS